MKEFLKDLWKEIRSKPELIILTVSFSITVVVAIASAIILAKVVPVWMWNLNHREFISRMNLLMTVMMVTVIQLVAATIGVFIYMDKKSHR